MSRIIGNILWPMICKFGSGFKVLGVKLGIPLSIAVAIAAGTVGMKVPTKFLGVPLSVGGGFLAGWMFAVVNAKARGLAAEEKSSVKELQKELNQATKERDKYKNQVEEIQRQNEELKHQRIEINEMEPVLKLGVVQLKMEVPDIKMEWMDEMDNGVFSDRRSRYIGIFRKKFDLTCGVDLKNVRIREENDRLRVVGVEPKNIGYTILDTDRIIRRKEKYKLKKVEETPDENGEKGKINSDRFKYDGKCYEIDWEEKFEGSLDLDVIKKFEKQEDDFLKRLNKLIGDEFIHINKYVKTMSEAFLRVILKPVGKSIEFDSTPLEKIAADGDWKSIKVYAEEFNKQNPKLLAIDSSVGDGKKGVL